MVKASIENDPHDGWVPYLGAGGLTVLLALSVQTFDEATTSFRTETSVRVTPRSAYNPVVGG